MKRILITGGPTNELVDEVMKITNMSTGSLSLDLTDRAIKSDCYVTLIITNSVTGSARYAKYGLANHPQVKTIPIETTQDMYEALEAASKESEGYDVIIHASAVGDYKPEFSFRLEDMAKELAAAVAKTPDKAEAELEKLLLDIMANPDCKVNDDSKISSYEPHLTVKLTLTTKLIANLRKWFPDAYLIGCKLLENVSKEHLVEVAQKLCIKNHMDLIMANDLAQLREGKTYRHLVDPKGYTGITLNEEGGIDLLDYAQDHWFK